MSKLVRLVGTFAPIPGATGFELPIFRAETSNMPMAQVIDHKGVVSALVHEDASPILNLYDQDIWTGVGSPAVYAVRMPNGGLEAGTREHLAQALAKPIDDGEFDATPVTRFRLSAFLRLGTRLATDAQTALTWVGSTSTPWAADNWKVEGTIVPEFSRRIEFALKEAGENDEVVQWACRGIQVKVDNDGRLALSVAVPGEGAEATRCRDILTKASETLIGEASEWWPELRGSRPRIVIPPPPVKPELERLPIWIISTTEDKPWADWIASTLSGAGYEATPFPDKLDDVMQRWREPAHILPLLSEQSAPSEWLRNQLAAIDGNRVLPIRVHDVASPPVLRDQRVTELWGILEEQAELRLLDAVDGPAPGWTFSPPANRPPFPGSQTIHNLPPRPNFVGRDTELAKLRDWMERGRTAEAANTLISGMPGIGKTALAIEAAYRNLEKFRVVWWIRNGHVNEDLAALAERLDFDAPDTAVLAEFATSWLSERHECLIVLDGDDTVFSSTPISDGPNFTIITSRIPSHKECKYIITLSGLNKNEAEILISTDIEERYKSLHEVIDTLGGHPLALSITPKWILRNTPVEQNFTRRKSFKKLIASFKEYIDSLDSICKGLKYTLMSTSFLGDATTPLSLLERACEPGKAQKTILLLQEAGLISFHNKDYFSLTNPTPILMQTITTRRERELSVYDSVRICAEEFSRVTLNEYTSQQLSHTAHGLSRVIRAAIPHIPIDGALFDLLQWTIRFLLFCGKYYEAEDIASAAMNKGEWTLFNRDNFARTQLAYGKTIFACGNYGEAYRVLSRAAHAAKTEGWRDVAAEAAVRAGTAILRNTQNSLDHLVEKHDHARQLISELLDSCPTESMKTLGILVIEEIIMKENGIRIATTIPDLPNNEPDTIRAWRMHIERLVRIDQADAAEPMLNLVKNATGLIWGREHPEMAETLTCISEAQMAIGDHDEAMQNAQAALRIASQKLGREHPLTLRLMNIVGNAPPPSISTAADDEDDGELSFDVEAYSDSDS